MRVGFLVSAFQSRFSWLERPGFSDFRLRAETVPSAARQTECSNWTRSGLRSPPSRGLSQSPSQSRPQRAPGPSLRADTSPKRWFFLGGTWLSRLGVRAAPLPGTTTLASAKSQVIALAAGKGRSDFPNFQCQK